MIGTACPGRLGTLPGMGSFDADVSHEDALQSAGPTLLVQMHGRAKLNRGAPPRPDPRLLTHDSLHI